MTALGPLVVQVDGSPHVSRRIVSEKAYHHCFVVHGKLGGIQTDATLQQFLPRPLSVKQELSLRLLRKT